MNAATEKAPIPMFTEHNAVRGDLREDGARFAGWTPGGSEWWAYSEEDFAPLCDRLDELRAKHEDKKTRRVKLTPAQFEIVEDVIASRAEGHDFHQRFKLRKTYIEGTSEQLADLATFVDPEDLAHWSEAGSTQSFTDAALAFAWRSGFVSGTLLRAKLEGKPTTLAAAKREAKRLRPF
jgi:hypothetical protein